jgi:biopolymer transport protein ExbD
MEMSPLIDCIFQLLIFFMLSSTFLTPAIKLTLPKASAEERPDKQQVLITLDPGGRVFVNTEEVTFDQLESELAARVAESSDKVVTIRGDENMKYEYFVRALEVAKSSGAVHVNIAHQSEDD